MKRQMKKALAFAALLACSVIIKDNYGVQLGTIGTDGAIRDNYGVVMGTVSNDGTVRDDYGNVRGTLDGNGCNTESSPSDGGNE